MFPATVISSSINQYLAAVAERVHRAGPNVLLQMMRAQLLSSNPMAPIERFGAATLPPPSRPAPARVIDISSRFQDRFPVK